ncbi:hypothetical protein F4775DRAFT_542038 [Biscogniauxia sp. FL1348]|nr:hypothetical protein F4775DRAFT_542038 [Biscogniauxia sp. FL1348]
MDGGGETNSLFWIYPLFLPLFLSFPPSLCLSLFLCLHPSLISKRNGRSYVPTYYTIMVIAIAVYRQQTWALALKLV